jgi:hypothetical protein
MSPVWKTQPSGDFEGGNYACACSPNICRLNNPHFSIAKTLSHISAVGGDYYFDGPVFLAAYSKA